VCDQLLRWQAAGVPLRPVAINLSARQFQQQDLETTIAAILGDTGIDAPLLEFELTEAMLMSDPEEAAATMRNLKARGIRLSVDDFGTGYSSLAQVKRFPIDALKIDRAFVCDVTTNREDASIMKAIIHLAHSLNIKVVSDVACPPRPFRIAGPGRRWRQRSDRVIQPDPSQQSLYAAACSMN
jgi:EAL domain-containing protein (putative c-di-GMP-specific phosphodiesterase class I)